MVLTTAIVRYRGIGAMLITRARQMARVLSKVLGCIAVLRFTPCINLVSGYLVNDRMLRGFR